MTLPFVRRSTYEAERDKRVEAQLQALERWEETDALSTALNAVENTLPKVPDESGTVVELDQECIGYKATDRAIVTLLIPEGERVVYPNEDLFTPNEPYKLRCGSATPIKILCGGVDGVWLQSDTSMFRGDFTYRVGEPAEPEFALDESTESACTEGIHFFRHLSEAKEFSDQRW